MTRQDEYTTGLAFMMWLSFIFGFCGVHRLYLGKKATGLLYLFTFGLLGIGQLYDALQMRRLVEDANIKNDVLAARAARRGLAAAPAALLPASVAGVPVIRNAAELRLALTRAAAKNSGAISVTQGVLATGLDFGEVEEALDTMAKSGYVGIDNDPDSGVVIYTFRELT